MIMILKNARTAKCSMRSRSENWTIAIYQVSNSPSEN